MRHQLTVASVAARQYGLITWQQLIAVGLDAAAIRRRVQGGLLFRVYPGVYRVGHWAPSIESHYLAAVLAAGDGAALAGPPAARLWDLVRGEPPPEIVSRRRIRIKGITAHEVHNLHATKRHDISVTTLAATLVALAESFSEEALARAVHEATIKYRAQPQDVEAVLDETPNAKGAQTLRRVLRGETKLVLSRLEKRFLRLMRENNLVLPQTNKPAGGRYVDCRWPEHKLTVELDSYRYHATRHAWEQDRKRERQARARGDDFRRYTSDDVFDDPRALLGELRPLIPAR